jgi:hypothetical protein
VLEALALKVPVVGCDNGTRPPGVITYAATDAGELAGRLLHTLKHRDEIAAGLAAVHIPDTLPDEVSVLTS